jgi:hypothetical protein
MRGGIVGGGESRSVGSPGRTRSGTNWVGAGWEAGARWVGSVHWRTKMCRRVYIYIYITSIKCLI